MTRIFSWQRIRIVLAVIALLAVVLVPSVVNGTVAGWKDSEESSGAFAAGSLNISDLTCSDNSTPLLGLLGNELRLDWTGPEVSDDQVLQYEITVIKRRPIITSTYNYETSDEFFVFNDGGILNVATYEMTVRAQPIGNWSGNSMSASGFALTGAILNCG